MLQKYPDCLPITPRLRELKQGHSVEALLQELQLESTKSPVRKRQIASIRYYLQEILTTCPGQWVVNCQEVLNHLVLLDDIVNYSSSSEHVCFVTFNYDRLIDWAFDKAGFRIESFQDYITKRFMLIKLHGSVNWGRVVATPLRPDILENQDLVAQELIRRCSDINISKEYVITTGSPPAPIEGRGIFPALAIPVETKLDFECPEEHVTALKEALPQVTKILIIGWRAAEQPFLELMKKGLCIKPRVLIVNREQKDCDDVVNALTRAGIFAQQTETHKMGFTDFILTKRGKPFFQS